MKKRLVYRIIVFLFICAIFPAILLTSVISAKSAENILFQSTFDNDDGIVFLKGSWTLSSGQLIPKPNDENRLVLAGTDKSDYIITSNATFFSGNTGQSGYGIYFRATNAPDISGYCFQYDNGVGKKFLVRLVTNGKEGAAQYAVSMSAVMGSDFDITAPHTVTITAIGSNFTIKVDDTEVIHFTDTTFTSGYVGLRSWTNSNNQFHDIKVIDLTPSLSPLGNTFSEITGNFIRLIGQFYADNGRYLSTWNDTRFTDIGLSPSDWSGYIEHIKYSPGGALLSITPEQGSKFIVMGIDGRERILTYDLHWRIVYDDVTKKWYYHDILPEEEIDISTFTVVAPPTPTATPFAVSPTAQPTAEVTATPMATVTSQPTPEPTAEPTVEPTIDPTAQPTTEPTAQPTDEPTLEPTAQPTPAPTSAPTIAPTTAPTSPAFSTISYGIMGFVGAGIGGFNGQNGSSAPAAISPKESAQVYGPRGLAIGTDGSVYIADEMNGAVRKVSGNTVTTIAGNGRENGYTPSDFTGAAYGSGMYEPMDVTVDSQENVIFLDTDHHIVRMIDGSGNLRTLAGVLEIGSAGSYSSGNGVALAARLNTPQGLAVDNAGNIYVADTNNHIIRKISPSGAISNIAGSPGISGFSGDGGAASAATLYKPMGLALDVQGNLYVADTFNHRIRKINLSTGIITTVAGSDKLPTNSATLEGVGDNLLATQASLFFPQDIAVDMDGNLYIADSQNHKIRKVMHSTGIVFTIAGDGYAGNSGNGGTATAARLSTPKGIAVDANGTVYISDTGNHSIKKLVP